MRPHRRRFFGDSSGILRINRVWSVVRIANCSGFYGDRLSARPGDGRRRTDRRAHRRLAGRADDADPRPHPGQAAGRRLRPHLRDPDGAGDGHLPRPRHQGRVQRRRARSRAAAPTAVAEVADRLGLSPVDRRTSHGDDLLARARRARRRRPRARPPRDRRGARRPARQVITANAYLGLLGHRRGPRRAAPTSSSPAASPTPRSSCGPAAWHARLGARRLGRAGRRRAWPATSSSAAPRRPAATTRSSPRCPDLRAPGLPVGRGRRRRVVGHRQARRHRRARCRSARSRRSCSTRSAAPRYLGPDVTARFDTIELERGSAPDRVRIAGVRGEPPPADAEGGDERRWAATATTFTFCLTGLDIEAKAALVEDQVLGRVPGRPRRLRAAPARQLVRTDHARPGDQRGRHRAVAAHREGPRRAQGRASVRRTSPIELALATIPGFYGVGGGPAGGRPTACTGRPSCPPSCAAARSWCWAATGPWSTTRWPRRIDAGSVEPAPIAGAPGRARRADRARSRSAAIVGARSGDKGGNANLGVFARSTDGLRLARRVPHRRAPRGPAAPRRPASTSSATRSPTSAR